MDERHTIFTFGRSALPAAFCRVHTRAILAGTPVEPFVSAVLVCRFTHRLQCIPYQVQVHYRRTHSVCGRNHSPVFDTLPCRPGSLPANSRFCCCRRCAQDDQKDSRQILRREKRCCHDSCLFRDHPHISSNCLRHRAAADEAGLPNGWPV